MSAGKTATIGGLTNPKRFLPACIRYRGTSQSEPAVMARRGGQERNGIIRYGTEKYDPTSRLAPCGLALGLGQALAVLAFRVQRSATSFDRVFTV